MTKHEIALRLRALSLEMLEVGTAMDFYGGFAHWARNGADMVGASIMAADWADAIEAELKSPTPSKP